jgi:hypothetical protein
VVSVTAYPVARKAKSFDVCNAFVKGCGGAIVLGASKLYPGAAFFYGVDASNESIWRQVQAEGRPYFYSDNAFFDETRQRYFRVAKNAPQIYGVGQSDCKRFDALGIEIKPWTSGGDHVVVAPQSSHFMAMVAGYDGEWTLDIIDAIQKRTKRRIKVRGWTSDKKHLADSIDGDLEGAHCLVTWSSAAAVTAVMRGVPVIAQGPSAASPMSGTLADIQILPKPDRYNWAGVLADNQWTLDEMADGVTWRALNA